MADVEHLLKEAVGELDRLLQARNVMGEPLERDGITVVPMVSYGFGFGAGGGEDAKAGGQGAGTGGGGGIKPVALLILDRDGVRVEPVRPGPTLVEALGTLAGKVVEGINRSGEEGARKQSGGD